MTVRTRKASGEGRDLRCHVREKLVEFLRREYPDCLQRLTEKEFYHAIKASLKG